jgi:hypothetical protein
VLAEIDFFVIGAIRGEADVEAEKTTGGRGCDVYVNDTVAHFEILEDGGATIDQETFAALILGGLGITFKIPARRFGRHSRGLSGLSVDDHGAKKNQNDPGQMSIHKLSSSGDANLSVRVTCVRRFR